MHDRALIHERHALIRTAYIEAECFGGELAHREHGLQLRANVRRKISARERVANRLAVPQNSAFLVRGACEVTRVASAEHNRREDQCCQAQQICRLRSRPRRPPPPPPRRPTPSPRPPGRLQPATRRSLFAIAAYCNSNSR